MPSRRFCAAQWRGRTTRLMSVCALSSAGPAGGDRLDDIGREKREPQQSSVGAASGSEAKRWRQARAASSSEGICSAETPLS